MALYLDKNAGINQRSKIEHIYEPTHNKKEAHHG